MRLIICFLVTCLLGGALIADESEKNSSSYLSPYFLTKFGEQSSRQGHGGQRGFVRLTIFRSHDHPIMIKWFSHEEGKSALVEVKKLKNVEKVNPIPRYELFYDRSFRIDENTSKSLSSVLSRVDLEGFPEAEWQGAVLDGSHWVYEFVGEKSSLEIIRQSPLSFEGLGRLEASRISQEMSLTSFGILLWGVSQNQEEHIY